MECNKLPYIKGEKGVAILDRIIIIPFDVTFTDDEALIKEKSDEFKPQVKAYKQDAFKKEHYSALL